MTERSGWILVISGATLAAPLVGLGVVSAARALHTAALAPSSPYTVAGVSAGALFIVAGLALLVRLIRGRRLRPQRVPDRKLPSRPNRRGATYRSRPRASLRTRLSLFVRHRPPHRAGRDLGASRPPRPAGPTPADETELLEVTR